MIKIAVAGFMGRMGRVTVDMVNANDKYQLVAVLGHNMQITNTSQIAECRTKNIPVYNDLKKLVDETHPDCVIDFTVPESSYENCKTLIDLHVASIIGTTGLTKKQISKLELLANDAQVAVIMAPNFAISAVLMMQFAKQAVKYFNHVEIIEMHDDKKLDAPSGTAYQTLQLLSNSREKIFQGSENEEQIIEGSRGGEYEGMRVHSVRLPGLVAHQEVIFGGDGEGLKIVYDAYNWESFMSGIRIAIDNIKDYNYFVYGLEKIIK